MKFIKINFSMKVLIFLFAAALFSVLFGTVNLPVQAQDASVRFCRFASIRRRIQIFR